MRGSLLYLFWACAALVLGISSVAGAQGSARLPLADVGRAAACYSTLDYRCVVDRLETFPARYIPPRPNTLPKGLRALDLPILLDVGRILALSYLALGEEVRAREVFAWVLLLDRSFVLFGSEISPRFLVIFHEVRASVLARDLGATKVWRAQALIVAQGRCAGAVGTAERVAAIPEPVEPPPPPPPTRYFALWVGAGWQFFGEREAVLYESASSLHMAADLYLGDDWLASLDVSRSRHTVRFGDLLIEGANTLELTHATVFLGWRGRLGAVEVVPGVGAGLSWIEVKSSASGVGGTLHARFQVRVPVWESVHVTADAGATGLMSLHAWGNASALWDGALMTGLVF